MLFVKYYQFFPGTFPEQWSFKAKSEPIAAQQNYIMMVCRYQVYLAIVFFNKNKFMIKTLVQSHNHLPGLMLALHFVMRL